MFRAPVNQICLIAALTLTTGATVSEVAAQQPDQPMSAQQMQAMMAYMQAVQACTAGLDESAMQTRAAQFHEQIGQLCAAGKRDEAQSKLMEYARGLADDPKMTAMHECMKNADSLRPDIPGMAPQTAADYSQVDTTRHVCDQP